MHTRNARFCCLTPVFDFCEVCETMSCAGFAANMAVVSSLASTGNVAVLSDELNHASIIDGG